MPNYAAVPTAQLAATLATRPTVEPSMFPLVAMQACSLDEANACLIAWGHKMGQFRRPQFSPARCHALTHEGAPVAITITASLIPEEAGGGIAGLTRETTVELARLCAARRNLCRAMLRLWREFVFPSLGFAHALSYQDADLHTGNTYRFDGWSRCPDMSRSGTDARSGARGRRKYVWIWPPIKAESAELADRQRLATTTD